MQIEVTSRLNKDNEGIGKLFKLVARKGNVLIDFQKGTIVIEDFTYDRLDDILLIIREHFEPTVLNFKYDKKFKLTDEEKLVRKKKAAITEEIGKKPSSIVSRVRAHILEQKVFTLTGLREAFPETNFATLRAYVNDLKHDDIIIELERGKYAVR